VAGEHPDVDRWLCFTWDGVGLGHDATLWGGETLLGRPGAWQRLGGLRAFRLPGGDKAGRQPWRSAAALCWEAGLDAALEVENLELARIAWERRFNCPTSSAAGRVFDAAACLVLGITHASYEGQGPMRLEAIADDSDDHVPLAVSEAQIDWEPLLPVLRDGTLSPGRRSALLHNSLAQAMVEQALMLAEDEPFAAIGLGGGVFQNRRLVGEVLRRARPHGLDVRLAEQLPCNDGGLSYGQVIEYLGLRA
jgi:hydrogenase maturation protein HypF